MTTQNTTIEAGKVITARSIGDWDCIFSATVISRKGNFVTLDLRNEIVRKMVKKDSNGNEYVLALGNYSMAPMFR